jgi:hypothetical protein
MCPENQDSNKRDCSANQKRVTIANGGDQISAAEGCSRPSQPLGVQFDLAFFSIPAIWRVQEQAESL